MTPSLTDPNCQSPKPCWEHWQPYLRVSERAIQLATDLIRLRVATLPLRGTIEDIQPIHDACDMLNCLRQRQWGEMVRRPFNFPAKDHPVPKPAPPHPWPKAAIEDLLL